MIYIENTTVRTEKSADYLGNAGLKSRASKNIMAKIIVKYVNPENTHFVITKYEEIFAMDETIVPLIRYSCAR